jgi:hypothetical protein
MECALRSQGQYVDALDSILFDMVVTRIISVWSFKLPSVDPYESQCP